MLVNMMRSAGVVQSSYHRMTRQHAVIIKRWRNKSSHDLKKEFEKFQNQKVTDTSVCQEILSRTRHGLSAGKIINTKS